MNTEELQLKLTANIADAKAKLQEFDTLTGKVTKNTKNMGLSFSKLRDIMQGPVAAFNMVAGGIKKVFAEMDKYIMAAAESEKATANLNAVLEATGGVSGMTRLALKNLSDEMARITLFEDEDVVQAEALMAATRKISGEVFPDAIKSAADLATVMGTDLVSATKTLNKMLMEPTKAAKLLKSANISLTDSQKAQIAQFAKVNDLAGQQKVLIDALNGSIGGAAEAAASTGTGSYMNLKKALGELNEVLGEAIANSAQWEKASKFLNDIIKGISDQTTTNKAKDKAKAVKELFNTRGWQQGGSAQREKMLKSIGFGSDDAKEAIASMDNLIKVYEKEAKQFGAIEKINDIMAFGAHETAAEKLKKLKIEREQMASIIPTLQKMALTKPSGFKGFKEDEQDIPDNKPTKPDITKVKTQEDWDKEFYAWLDSETKKVETEVQMQQELLDAETDADKAFIKDKQAREEEAAKAVAEMWKESYYTIKDAAMNTWDSINSLVENNNDIYLKSLEEQGASEEQLAAEKNRIGLQEFNSKKLTSIANIAISTAEGVMKAMSASAPPGNLILAGIVTAAGAVQAAMAGAQQYVPMAEGGSGIVTKPTLFLAGEAGPEPFAFGGANNKRGMNMGSTVHLHFNGSPWAIQEAEAVAASAIAKANRGW